MTTTNNHLTLIDQVGGIEKVKMIVEGAPEGSTHIGNHYTKLDGVNIYAWVDQEWVKQDLKLVTARWLASHEVRLIDLHTAIAQHDKTWVEKRFGIKKWHPIPEHHMCADKRLDDTTDHITDIRNHISSRTIVWDLASGKDWSVNHG